MRHVTFSADDLRAIAWERYHHPDPRVQRKMTVLWLKHQGLPHRDIAALADVSRRSVQRYLAEFLQGGLRRSRQANWVSPTSVLDQHRQSLEDHFRQQPPHSVKQARQVIEQRTGVRRGLTQVRRFLHRLGLSTRKVAAVPLPPKRTAEEHSREQRRFVDEELEPLLAEARAGRREVYFVDGVHFLYATVLGWVWCWVRWCVRAAAGRKRYNVLGAVHAVSHRLVRVANHTYLNATSVCDLLRQVAKAHVGRPITLVLDNARYQKCALVKDLAAALGIHLLYLPSYSPNLNLIERVWKFVKKQCLASVHYPTYEVFTAAIDNCLAGLDTTHERDMKSLLTHKFQMFDSVSFVAA
jgi:transposase